MKVVIYNRVSTDDKGQDPMSNIHRCRDYCNLNNHKVIMELYDEGISGDTFFYDRPKGKELQELIHNKKIEGIVVFSIDRFSRQNPLKILPLLEGLKEKGITFISVTEPAFNMEGDFAEPMRYILTWFSSYFLTQHKKKVNAGIENARIKGTKSGLDIGRPMKRDYTKILELHSTGRSISSIAKELNCSKSSVSNAIKKNSGSSKPLLNN